MCVLCGCVEDRKELELRGFVRVTCASSPPDIHAPPSELRSLTRGPPITGFESSVCCVIYCYPTSYRGRSTLGTHSFPEGQGTLFTGIYIYQSWYIATYIWGVCVVCAYIS